MTDTSERMHTRVTGPCDRCGRRRVINGSRDAGLCQDCRYTDPLCFAATKTPDGCGDTLSATHRATLPAPTRRATT